MESCLFAVVLGVVAAVLVRKTLDRRGRAWVAVLCGALVASTFAAVTSQLSADDKKAADTEQSPVPKKFVKPDNWPKGHPLPLEASNCATCHLTAGRELTAAVINFTRSVHDLQHMSCSDCHGGNTENDVARTRKSLASLAPRRALTSSIAASATTRRPKCWPRVRTPGTSRRRSIPSFRCASIATAITTLATLRPISSWRPGVPIVTISPKRSSPIWRPWWLATISSGGRCVRYVSSNIESTENPVPEPFRKEVDSLRHATMNAIHKSAEISPADAEKLNQRSDALRKQLDQWLQSNP